MTMRPGPRAVAPQCPGPWQALFRILFHCKTDSRRIRILVAAKTQKIRSSKLCHRLHAFAYLCSAQPCGISGTAGEAWDCALHRMGYTANCANRANRAPPGRASAVTLA
jgi:hypothetical protein